MLSISVPPRRQDTFQLSRKVDTQVGRKVRKTVRGMKAHQWGQLKPWTAANLGELFLAYVRDRTWFAMKVAESLAPTEPRICAALLNTGSGGPRIIPQNALEDTGVYGLPDAVLVPSIGVSGGQWVPSGDKKPNAGQLVQTTDGLRLAVVTPPAWRIGTAGLGSIDVATGQMFGNRPVPPYYQFAGWRIEINGPFGFVTLFDSRSGSSSQ